MRDINYTPKNDTSKISAIICGLCIGAAFLFTMYLVLDMLNGFFLLGFVGFAVAAIFFTIRYLMSTYTYTLTDRYGEIMLIVTLVVGKRISCVCRIPAKDIIEVCEIKKGRTRLENEKRYNYRQGLGSSIGKLVVAKVDGVNLAVALDIDSEFEHILASFIHK